MTGGEEIWLGIDLGTQSVRALAVTASGAVVGRGTHPLTGRREGQRHEQDPEEWWRATAAACRSALDGVPAGAVRAVAVDGTSGTILLTDGDGRPLTPGLMYDDTRAADETRRVNETGAAVWDELGYRRMQPAWALPKLLWLLGRHEGPVHLAHQADFVNRRLAGHAVPADLSNALKTGAHLVEEDWPADVLDTLGVPREVLPPLVRSGTPIGTVCASAAEATGIPAGTSIVAGMTDGCAAQLGAGRLTPGSWNSVLGTTLVLKGVTREPLHDPYGVVYSHRAPDGAWLPGGASSTGAGAISRDFPGRDLAELDRRAADHEPARALAYPLVSRGERFPFAAPDAEGFLLGGTGDEADDYAALLQGVAYLERLCFDHLDLLGAPVDGDLTFTGGTARSAYWCRLRARVLGRPVILPADPEPALGAAVLAASPGRRVAEVAAAMVAVRETIDPGPRDGRFDEGYLRFVTELERRGWLPEPTAEHARTRTDEGNER
ncbi:FGGY-family carbohydrate kinase [Actinoallomurus iriomotensis]|uniref:Carbohydrate kinase n=1 Tax=Actinoallomurus iriomotensis TaxID=478107 RepID=A0A9W6RP05_9ACTN|nr:FGGY family carbohydrate kinase [Actinoallomurus iriomotensis]GLY79158.1 carbohydrate kinase [Actinoallomurus iriomotensis]